MLWNVRTSAENTKDMNDLVGAVERIPESLARSDGRHESMPTAEVELRSTEGVCPILGAPWPENGMLLDET